ncbi:MAG TPA: hypothetical protein EYF95_10045 [Flavobacteriales bacterium]|nr:hypothetical protein [Flavobacteriales bacterium]HIK68295.1 hypothetical protein [Flavobacteriales bacterium]
MIDTEADVAVPQQEDLAGIAELGARQVHLTAELAVIENALALKKEELRQVVEIELPESMLNLGLTSFSLSDGSKISVETFYRGSIPKAREVEAFNWLKEYGHEDLIKNEVKCTFGKGEDQDANALMIILSKQGQDYENKKAVHPSTLKAFVREQLERGNTLPLDILGVYVGQKSKIRS